MSTREEKLAWLRALVPDAQRAKLEWPGMRVAVCLAQAALESAWGERAIGGYNLWGLKDLKWNPGKVLVKTHEWVKLETIPIELRKNIITNSNGLVYIEKETYFEDFATLIEAMLCYGRLLTNSPTYKSAREAPDLEEYVAELCKYWATDPMYRKKVWTLIQYANLEGLDG